MKLLSVIRWIFSIQTIVCCVAVPTVDVPNNSESLGHSERSRSLMQKHGKGCKTKVRTGKGMKAMSCTSTARPRVMTTARPRVITAAPRKKPTARPTSKPSAAPTKAPTATPTSQPTADACLTYQTNPLGTNPSNLYGVTSKTLGFTWLEAQATVSAMKSCCGEARPHLVAIGSSQENAFVLSLLSTAPGGVESAFLGLTNRGQSSDTTFVWDGTTAAFSYQNWCTPDNGNCLTTEPDNGPNACAAMVVDIQDVAPGVWVDYDCDLTAPSSFVFEYDCLT